MKEQDDASRWGARPRLAALVRALIMVGPLAVSLPAGWLASRLLPLGPGLLGWLLHAAGVLALSTVALLATDRLGRRLVPLATLLQVTLLFPDAAPSRMAVARNAIRGLPVEEHLRRVAGAGDDPGAVAREIIGLVSALDNHDRPTRGHAERVRLFTDLVADEMHLPRPVRDRLRWASLLHDVGKLTVPTEILNKPGKPDESEWEVLKAHPARGREIAAPLLPWLGEAGRVIVEHHERWDGTGYPDGLSGADIGLCSRIVAVADALDVMTAVRAYRRPVSRAAALDELVRCAGGQFDPEVVRAMISVSAPKLRRVQGLLGWLGDIPFVATQAVPAALVARVAGAAALAMATPGVATLPSADSTPAPRDAAAAQAGRTPGSGGASSATGGGAGSSDSGATTSPGATGTAPTGGPTSPTGTPVPTSLPTTSLPGTAPPLPLPGVTLSVPPLPLPTLSVSPIPLPTISVPPIPLPGVTISVPPLPLPTISLPPLPLPTISLPLPLPGLALPEPAPGSDEPDELGSPQQNP